ncbi:MAG: EF-hand domain-containing protein [Sphingomonas sp.]|nr:MAG: EF-hand domain-containing protein [Sphingomonas sp.]
MRIILVIGVAAALAGCASQATQRRGGYGASEPGHRPAHGRGQLFISPMGEPFRASSRSGAAQSLWFTGADADGDGRITLAEFQRDAARFFAVLDRAKDGEIDPEDIAYYENVLVPEIRVATGGRGPMSEGGGGRDGNRNGGQGSGSGGGGSNGKKAAAVHERIGAARFGFFDLPEPVIAADVNLNRGIDTGEFATAAATRFTALDRNHDGGLARGELPRAGGETWRNGSDQPVSLLPEPGAP